MKLLFLCCFLIFACLSQAKKYVYKEDEYKASLKAWQDLKSKAYTFVMVDAGEFRTGRTTIKVRNGQVVSRKYVQTKTYHLPHEVVESWSETTPQTIGSHEGGYPVSTFDEVYADCIDNILTQKYKDDPWENPENPRYFGDLKVDENGLLSLCAFYHDYGIWGNVINVESIRYC